MSMQHTIGKSVSLTGTGLHTGVPTKVTLHPERENYGIRFVRADLEGRPEIVADIDNVVDLARGTAIGRDGIRVCSIEHVMSCFAGLGIDNCRVEAEAQEIPLMDGSSMPYVKLVHSAGIVEQDAPREFLSVDEPVIYVKGDVALSAFPLDRFRLTLEIDYNYPALGAQYTTIFSLDDFVKEFAPARTFCFLSEIEKLREQGLIKGGSLDSALVVQDVELTKEHVAYIRKLFGWQGPIEAGKNGFLNDAPLRYWNEPCRHKALDLVGDLYLLGRPLNAHIIGARTGHAANIAIARQIREHIKKRRRLKLSSAGREAGSVPCPYDEILRILPHRHPFLLIDRVVELVPNKKILACKNVSFNDHFFQGHFPGNPVMPGVLQIEAMAQAGGIMSLHTRDKEPGEGIMFLGIDKARFRGIVRPGDVLRIECTMVHDRKKTIKFVGKCFVEDELVCEAEMLAMLGKAAGSG